MAMPPPMRRQRLWPHRMRQRNADNDDHKAQSDDDEGSGGN